MDIAGFIIANIVIGYLFGSLSPSIIIGKNLFNKDPRDYESKNAGATNASRVFGKKIGLFVLLFDVLKSIIPTLIIWGVTKNIANPFPTMNSESFDALTLVYLCPLFVIIGHCYPVFFNFKGGKGAACYAALIIMVSPLLALLLGLIFLIVAKKTKIVSFSVLIIAVFCPFLILIPGFNYFCLLQRMDINHVFLPYELYGSLIFIFLVVVIALLILVYKHKENIVRIKNHTERKIDSEIVVEPAEEIKEEVQTPTEA